MEELEEEKQKRIEAFQSGDVRWYEEEFMDLHLRDKRLSKRFGIIMNARMQKPNCSIPNSMDSWKQTKGAYRFFSNNKVETKLILDSHLSSTIKRFKDKQIILAPQDTTDITYPNHKATKGLGYINDSEYTKGYFFHPTLAVTVEGTPLGILDSQVWVRETKNNDKTQKEKKLLRKKSSIEEKESYKWLKSFNTLCEIENENNKEFHFVSICDREGDLFELFHAHAKITNENKPDLLIRARTDRNISDGEE